jgi:type I restriction enzyme S subunit
MNPGMKENSNAVLLSIRPKYVKAMNRNEKLYEFRKTIFDTGRIERVIIYSTSPVKKISATFRTRTVVKASPDELWTRFGDVSGLK